MLFQPFYKRNMILLVVFSLGLSLLLVGCNGNSAGGDEDVSGTDDSQSTSSDAEVTFDVVTPPDPNAFPLLLLDAKQEEWLDDVALNVSTAPAGDPGAMRALLHSKEADFALFNALGGAKNYENGLQDLRLLGVHIWKGVYILAREDVNDWGELDGEKALAVPGVGTTPEIMAQKSLAKHDVGLNFAGMGPGLSLWTALSKENSEIEAVAAPEPIVSMLMMRQEKEDWDHKFHVFADLSKELNESEGRIPLGGLILVDQQMLQDDRKRDASEKFEEAFAKAITYMSEKENEEEVTQILAKQWKDVFSQDLPQSLFVELLSSGRMEAQYKPAYDVKEEAIHFWDKYFEFKVADDYFIQGVE